MHACARRHTTTRTIDTRARGSNVLASLDALDDATALRAQTAVFALPLFVGFKLLLHALELALLLFKVLLLVQKLVQILLEALVLLRALTKERLSSRGGPLNVGLTNRMDFVAVAQGVKGKRAALATKGSAFVRGKKQKREREGARKGRKSDHEPSSV